jgi:hypothetical protein
MAKGVFSEKVRSKVRCVAALNIAMRQRKKSLESEILDKMHNPALEGIQWEMGSPSNASARRQSTDSLMNEDADELRRQGDMGMHTVEALMQRNNLRKNNLVRASILRFWRIIDLQPHKVRRDEILKRLTSNADNRPEDELGTSNAILATKKSKWARRVSLLRGNHGNADDRTHLMTRAGYVLLMKRVYKVCSPMPAEEAKQEVITTLNTSASLFIFELHTPPASYRKVCLLYMHLTLCLFFSI